MHLPLIDIPKPKRSARPRCASACVLFAFWLAAFSPWLQRSPQEEPIVIGCPSAAESSPVKYVTVKIIKEYSGGGGCGHISISTHQMPLLELYDELCEMQDKAVRTIPLCGFTPADAQEKVLLRAEKVFARKYGLTLKQVAMIKWEGYRMKREAGQ